ncbi:hypothetical protein [Streptomyces sp. NPDC047014]|uniref:hypothetical protein n=1 Tax=Streptomyces sp. NPDC047014 TaxID=3155736 RepID=UPI0033FC42DE
MVGVLSVGARRLRLGAVGVAPVAAHGVRHGAAEGQQTDAESGPDGLEAVGRTLAVRDGVP